jgi:hypothetical protein
MDMGSEHYCIPFLENLLSKLEKYKTIYITRGFDNATIRIGYDEFILQCLPDGSLKVSIAMKGDDNYHYDVATEYIKAWQDMNRLGDFIIALAIRNSIEKIFAERRRKRSMDEVKSVA